MGNKRRRKRPEFSESSLASHSPPGRNQRRKRSESAAYSSSSSETSLSPLRDERQFYGMLRVCRWIDCHEEIRQMNEYHQARDIPRDFHAYMTRADPIDSRQLVEIFLAAVREHTCLDEPDAPPLIIENVVDSERTPPWTAFYSNRIWHGDNVPPPNLRDLGCCDCVGSCARNDKCACKGCQAAFTGGPVQEGFLYDDQGCLLSQYRYVPIVKCNSLCRCDDDCINRVRSTINAIYLTIIKRADIQVVQFGRRICISISKMADKGWGG